MNDLFRTACYVISAGIVGVTAWWVTSEHQTNTAVATDDVGKPVAPEFDDVSLVSSLDVHAWNARTAKADRFGVRQKSPGEWVIDSHFEYPLTSNAQLIKVASQLLGLKKEALVSRRPADHARFGVLDPLDNSFATPEGYGVRLTLEGEGERTLLDVVLGKAVPNRDGMRYLRVPPSAAVYMAPVELDLSVDFADWIDPHLLGIKRENIVELLLNQYVSVPPPQGQFFAWRDANIVQVAREEPAADWVLSSVPPGSRDLLDPFRMLLSRFDDWVQLATGSRIDKVALGKLLQTIETLSIETVRPKPTLLRPDLTLDRDALPDDPLQASFVLTQVEQNLKRRGFDLVTFRGGVQKLVARRGQIRIRTGDGVVCTLYLGDVFNGNPQQLKLSGAADEGDSDSGATAGAGAWRYLFVTATFDESLIGPQPSPPDESTTEADMLESANAAYREDLKLWEQRKADGVAAVAELQRRVGPWYFVLSDDVIRNFLITPDELVAASADGMESSVEEPPPSATDPEERGTASGPVVAPRP